MGKGGPPARSMPPGNIELYSGLMDELAYRIDLTGAEDSDIRKLPGKLALEFYYLQIRMVCEIIALACLLAHGDNVNKLAKSLRDQWHAQLIVRELANLNPNFFPQAVMTPPGAERTFQIVSPQPLTKKECLAIYGRCGDGLHRGSLDRLLSSVPPLSINLDEPVSWAVKIRDLMRYHLIASPQANKVLLCAVHHPVTQKPMVLLAERALLLPPSRGT